MTKKEILVTVIVLLSVVGLSVGGYLLWDHYDTWKKAQNNQQPNVVTTPPSDNISLNSNTQNNDNSDPNALKVDLNSGSNSAQLGSGQSKTTAVAGASSSSSSGSSSAPGPDNFSQYDQYKTSKDALFGDVVVGTGAEATVNKKVAITYKGWLTDGTLFDQSHKDESGKLQPLVFTVGAHEVVLGMEQDIIGMKVGGTRRMIIPPSVGYGDKAQGPIPANSVLVFDVQLVAVQ